MLSRFHEVTDQVGSPQKQRKMGSSNRCKQRGVCLGSMVMEGLAGALAGAGGRSARGVGLGNAGGSLEGGGYG